MRCPYCGGEGIYGDDHTISCLDRKCGAVYKIEYVRTRDTDDPWFTDWEKALSSSSIKTEEEKA